MRKRKRTWFVTAALGLLVMGGASMPAKINMHARMNMRARTMGGSMMNSMRIMPALKGSMTAMRETMGSEM